MVTGDLYLHVLQAPQNLHVPNTTKLSLLALLSLSISPRDLLQNLKEAAEEKEEEEGGNKENYHRAAESSIRPVSLFKQLTLVGQPLPSRSVYLLTCFLKD